MSIKKAFLLLVLCFPVAALTVGCGSEVAPGVADGEDVPEPEMTEEEEAAEAEAAAAAAN